MADNMISAPNESKITGIVVKTEPTPDGVGHLLEIELEKSEKVGDLPNFAKHRIDQTILVCTQLDEKIGKQTLKNKKIRANVSFQGDERGGIFFIVGDNIDLVKS